MKKIIALIVFLVAATCSVSNAKGGLQHFYDQHRSDKNVEHLTVPKFLLYFSDNDPETRAVVRYIKWLKIFNMEGLNEKREAIASELEGALKQDNFESILQVTDDGERINIYINQGRKFVRRVLITVDSKDELVVLQAKTKISFDRLSAMMNDYKSGKDKTGLKKLINHK